MTNNAIDTNIPIDVSKGGTGNSSLTANGVLVGNGTNAIMVLAVGATNTTLIGNTGANPSFSKMPPAAITNGTSGQILIGGGSGLSWQNITAGSNITITNAANALTIASSLAATGGASSVSFFAYCSANVVDYFGIRTSSYTIPVDTLLYNVGSAYNVGTRSFTAPYTGKYCFAINFAQTNSDGAISASDAALYVTNPTNFDNNGFATRNYMCGYTTIGAQPNNAYIAPNRGFGDVAVCGYVELPLTAGDIVQFIVTGYGGSSSNNLSVRGKSGSTYYTCIMGALL